MIGTRFTNKLTTLGVLRRKNRGTIVDNAPLYMGYKELGSLLWLDMSKLFRTHD